MKISIAMATYNGEKFVLEQLESFMNQMRKPDELVIVDDCSTDETVDILNKFKNNAPFEVKIYVNETNLGYTQNFNRALELCTGDLIFLSDQDDVWFPTKIEYMLGLATEHPKKALYMIDVRLTDEKLVESQLTKQGQIRDLGLTEKSFVMGCCIAIKRNLLQPILPIPISFVGHDNWLVSIADMLDLRYIDKSIQQYYRIHENNTSDFIANTLTKMEKMEKPKVTIRKKIVGRFRVSKISNFNDFINKNSIFIKPLQRLVKEQYYPSSRIALNNIVNKNQIYNKRLNIIKSKDILDRAVKSLKFYFDGGYDNFSGFKSFLSDILRSK